MSIHSRSRYQVIPNGVTKFTMGRFEVKTSGNAPSETWERHGISGNLENLTPQFPHSHWKLCFDENHSPQPTQGGPLRIQVVDFSPMLGTVTESGTFYNRDNNFRYVGGFSFRGTSFLPPGFYLPGATDSQKRESLPSMTDRASSVYNGAKPKIQQVGALNALYELRELPSMLRTTALGFHELWTAAGGRPSASGLMAPSRGDRYYPGVQDHFLNHQFGWVPFIGDVRRMINTYYNADNHIRRISADNGRSVRRRFALKDVVSETVVASNNAGFHFPILFDSTMFKEPGGKATGIITDRVIAKTWGSGKFRYYKPEFDLDGPDYSSGMNQARRLLSLYGVRVNPSNLYQAIPWSWAVDWFTNTGDYVSRLSDIMSDGLMAEYFYAMHSEDRVRTFRSEYPLNTRYVSCETSIRMSSKQRVEASSPLGFSLSWGNLSPRQIAIAAALGISAAERRR
jgi:hypothetical protein